MFRRAGLAAIVLIVLFTGSVSAATKAVDIQGTAYNPAKVTIGRGTTVAWTNHDPFSHSATSDLAGYFSTSTFGNGVTRSFTFTQAGTFAYHCVIHSTMHGKVKVKMAVSPTSGTHKVTVFTLKLATTTAPSGYTHDVQYSLNGAAFVSLTSTTGMTRSFGPVNSTGTYRFHTRLRNTSTNAASAWSPVASAKVV